MYVCIQKHTHRINKVKWFYILVEPFIGTMEHQKVLWNIIFLLNLFFTNCWGLIFNPHIDIEHIYGLAYDAWTQVYMAECLNKANKSIPAHI